ncbi:hypothetical protein ACWGDS_25290 [Streptomyces sp. NPDC055059]|uniref:hypothetical protein n=1 Tax=Streptomyces sp. NPDC127172 TaxID=3345382 RepID=UPI003639C26E
MGRPYTPTYSDGGVDLTIRLTAAGVVEIGLTEPEAFMEHMDAALRALTILRSGRTMRFEEPREITADDLGAGIRQVHPLGHGLKPVGDRIDHLTMVPPTTTRLGLSGSVRAHRASAAGTNGQRSTNPSETA